MNSLQKVILFQNLPDFINRWFRKGENIPFLKSSKSISIIEDINYFKNDIPKARHALISLSPDAWITAIQEYPEIKLFNVTGLTYELVKALNENGYLVDIVDYRNEFLPVKKYDLFIGHGGKCKTIIDNLTPNAKILQYVSGAYWKLFNKESEERYINYFQRKNLPLRHKFVRSLDGSIDGEEYLTRKAQILFTSNCPRMIESFGEYKEKFYYANLASYIYEYMVVPWHKKDFNAGRKNFIYVAGTGGNVQKGMDVIIDAFTRSPDFNLYIFCKLEDEILQAYKNELKLPNIHYIYHYRFKPFHRKLQSILASTNFSIHAPINTGVGTAFTGSMGTGLIPVGYIDLVAPEDSCVITSSWDIDSIVECIREASGKSATWCAHASTLTKENYNKYWSIESFRANISKLITRINDGQN